MAESNELSESEAEHERAQEHEAAAVLAEGGAAAANVVEGRPCNLCNGTARAQVERLAGGYDDVECWACNGTGLHTPVVPVDVPSAPPLAARLATLGEDVGQLAVGIGYAVSNWVEPRERQLRGWLESLRHAATVMAPDLNEEGDDDERAT